MPWSRPSCPSRRSRSGPAARSPCTTTSRRARPRLLLRLERGCSSCMARAGACCSTSHWYATQGSNPRPAGRAPGRSATHTCEPRLGQIAHFAAAGHEVIAFDYVGCGRSPKPQSWYAGLASAAVVWRWGAKQPTAASLEVDFCRHLFTIYAHPTKKRSTIAMHASGSSCIIWCDASLISWVGTPG